jgi:hypothetical protein
VYADDGTKVLENGTDGTDATFTGSILVGSDANGDVYYRASGKTARLAKGTAMQVLAMNSGATAPEWQSHISFDAYVKVSDVKAASTNGGTATAGSWETRTINTEDTDTASIASISSNQVTLPEGTYYMSASAPAHQVQDHQIRLYDATGAAVLLLGSSDRAMDTDASVTRSCVGGKFTIAGSSAIEVQHRVAATKATTGYGVGNSWGNNVYTTAEFWRVKE